MHNVDTIQKPLFTVDSVLFTIHADSLKVLMVKRAEPPFLGHWALPGGFIDIAKDHDTDMTAKRKLLAKTGFIPNYLEQLQVFSGQERDPRGYSVTLAYFALVAHQPVLTQVTSVESAAWVNITELEHLNIAFDHRDIIELARQRLKQKTLYSLLPVHCLPSHFTISQLIAVIEKIIEKPIQRKSLMRRIEASNMFNVSEQKVSSGGRFAQVYSLKPNVSIVHFERNLSV